MKDDFDDITAYPNSEAMNYSDEDTGELAIGEVPLIELYNHIDEFVDDTNSVAWDVCLTLNSDVLQLELPPIGDGEYTVIRKVTEEHDEPVIDEFIHEIHEATIHYKNMCTEMEKTPEDRDDKAYEDAQDLAVATSNILAQVLLHTKCDYNGFFDNVLRRELYDNL